jgi:hypothetical protein
MFRRTPPLTTASITPTTAAAATLFDVATSRAFEDSTVLVAGTPSGVASHTTKLMCVRIVGDRATTLSTGVSASTFLAGKTYDVCSRPATHGGFGGYALDVKQSSLCVLYTATNMRAIEISKHQKQRSDNFRVDGFCLDRLIAKSILLDYVCT